MILGATVEANGPHNLKTNQLCSFAFHEVGWSLKTSIKEEENSYLYLVDKRNINVPKETSFHVYEVNAEQCSNNE